MTSLIINLVEFFQVVGRLQFGIHFGWRNRKNSEPFFGMINLIITHESGIFRGKMNSVDTQIKLMQQQDSCCMRRQ